MNKSIRSKTLLQTKLAIMIATLMIGGLASTLWSADSKPDPMPPKADSTQSSTNSVAPNPVPPPGKKTAIKHQLTGAELYSMHCNRCHPERYPTERTAAQWKTIMLHMQVRANLPGGKARLILKYLQENSGR
jgi:hypothetical protein